MISTFFPSDPRRCSRALLAFLYFMLAVLFSRTIWAMWDVRDVTSGDTSSYYSMALDFSRSLICDIAWSPLYTSYFGAFHWWNPDPVFVVLAHRIGILIILAVLIFEVSRRLLHPMIAWLVTAWWIVLPINFNALYEVHLFAIIPIAIFWILLANQPSIWRRGAAIGVLMVTTILVRNELLIALGMFTALSVGFDLWLAWRGKSTIRPLTFLAAYGVPVICALALIGVSYVRSVDKFPGLSTVFKFKHTLNVAQIYAFNYGQRHPEYTGNPWTVEGDKTLMVSKFGQALPTMREAFFANPREMTDYFLWNVGLIPAGMQVALFNVRSGSSNPDYAETKQNVPVALACSALYLAILALGAGLLFRNFPIWKGYLGSRAWLWIGIATVSSTVVIVMIMQRPRPSYMFAQTLAMMWLAGFFLQVILHHLAARWRAWGTSAGVVAIAGITFLSPQYYVLQKNQTLKRRNAPVSKTAAAKPSSLRKEVNRPLLQMLRLLQPYKPWLEVNAGQIAVPGFMFELNSYLGMRGSIPSPRTFDLSTAVDGLKGGALNDVLKKENVVIAIIPMGYSKRWPGTDEFVAQAAALGWRLAVAPKPPLLRLWMFVRSDVPAPQTKPFPEDIL